MPPFLSPSPKAGFSVDEAKDISATIETHRRTIESVELEERIVKLEKAMGTGK